MEVTPFPWTLFVRHAMRRWVFSLFCTLSLLSLTVPSPAALKLGKKGTTLGGRLTLPLVGDRNETFLLIPSLNGGPTRLSLADPRDPRSLSVGLDLLFLAQVGVLDGTGRAVPALNLPADPVLQGTLLHWQALTLPGKTYLVDDISNPVLTLLGISRTFSLLPGRLPFSTTLPGVAVLKDGRILVCGGGQGNMNAGGATKKTAVFDPSTYTWRRGPDMLHDRGAHVTIRLKDGRVLVCGGTDTQKRVLSSCEIYDPARGRWTYTGSMTTARVGHQGVLLPDGKVLVCGGTRDVSDPVKAIKGALKSAEIYDPARGRWSRTSDMHVVRFGHTLTLAGSRAVAAEGLSVKYFLGIPIPNFQDSAEYFYKGRWYYTGKVPGKRAGHSAVTLSNGKILLCGGVYGSNILDPNSYKPLSSAALYDPSTNRWRSLPSMRTARGLPTLLALPGGKALVSGGAAGTYAKPVALASCEIFNGSSFSYNRSSMRVARGAHVIVPLPEGSFLLIAGAGGSSNTSLSSCEIFFP